MNLLIDIGNSRVKWCALDSDVDIANVDPQCMGATTPDQSGAALLDAITSGMPRGMTPESVWISSVGESRLVDDIAEVVRDRFDCDTFAVEPSASAMGVTNSYPEPARMGVDRWVALIAARHAFMSRDVVVVDAGTAITVDTLRADGTFVGGLILPGAWLSRRALLSNTDRILESEESDDVALSPFGVTTAQCVHRGSLFAAVGGVQLAITQVAKTMGAAPKVVVCGGGADTIAAHLEFDCEVRPWLVLEGLALMARLGDGGHVDAHPGHSESDGEQEAQ